METRLTEEWSVDYLPDKEEKRGQKKKGIPLQFITRSQSQKNIRLCQSTVKRRICFKLINTCFFRKRGGGN